MKETVGFMKNKRRVFTVGVILLTSSLAVHGSRKLAVSDGVTTHCVPDLNVVPHCGAAYPTIQQAIDQAAPGETVRVGPGIYYEQLRITTSGLQILGAVDPTTDNSLSIIDGRGLPQEEPLILIADANGIEFSGFTVQSSAVAAIALFRSHFSSICDNFFLITVTCDPTQNPNCPSQISGVVLSDDSTYNDISENTLWGNDTGTALLPQQAWGGIILSGPTPGALKTQHNTVRNNFVRSFDVGIGDFGGRNNIIRCNVTIENLVGIELFWTYGAQVYNNKANRNGTSSTGGGGIKVQSSDGSQITENDAQENVEFGLFWARVGPENPFTTTDPNPELINTLNDHSGIARNNFRDNVIRDISIALHFPDDGQRSTDPIDDPGRCNEWIRNKVTGGIQRYVATPCP